MKKIYLIGITLRKDEKDKQEFYVKYRYFFNSNILFVPLYNHPKINLLLSICDGFILTGGSDYDPSLYHQKINCKTSLSTKDDDELDYEILNYCKNNNSPLLGICRGIQGINIFFGGSLKQDIKNHSNTNHLIISSIDKKTYLVNSFHHQAIDKMGANLDILFISEDGIIEMLKHKFLPILGVQWHPEMNLNQPINKFVFDEFLKLVGEYYEKRDKYR